MWHFNWQVSPKNWLLLHNKHCYSEAFFFSLQNQYSNNLKDKQRDRVRPKSPHGPFGQGFPELEWEKFHAVLTAALARGRIYFPLSPERNREERKWQKADNLYFILANRMTMEKTTVLGSPQEISHRMYPFEISKLSVSSVGLCPEIQSGFC